MPDILDRPVNGWWRDTEPLTALLASAGMPGQGPTFTMPLVVQEGVRVEDGRQFTPGGVTARSLPLPVMATWTTDDGHDGAVLVGLLTSLTRDTSGRWNGAGYFDTSPAAMEAARLVDQGILTGVSVDVASNDITLTIPAESQTMEEGADGSITFPIAGELIDFQTAQIIGVTICPMPAFENARIVLDAEPPTMEAIAAAAAECPPCEAALRTLPRRAPLAAAAVDTEAPPRAWFEDPHLDGPTPLTVQPDGRVFGHAATWSACHRGINDSCVTAPRSMSAYAHFRTGSVLCDDGTVVATGPLTVGTGHASLSADARSTVAHYDSTGAACADVAVGEDEHGIWVAGAIRPGATPEQVYALRASSLSGDWRPIGGQLELVALLAVNVPGFAVQPYALAASGAEQATSLGWREKDGQMLALVAAGAAPLMQAKAPVTRAELDAVLNRVRKIEAATVARKFDRDELRARRAARASAVKEKLIRQ